MTHFRKAIQPHVQAELRAAQDAAAQNQLALAFHHLERAHVLGQASTAEHVRVHWNMFLWAVRNGNARECFGQVFRIIGAATKTAIGLVPYGNTGGCNVSPFKRMPVSPELEKLIQQARSSGR